MEELLKRALNYYSEIIIRENLSELVTLATVGTILKKSHLRSYNKHTTKSLDKLSGKNIKLIAKNELLRIEEDKILSFSDNLKFYRNLALSNTLVIALTITSLIGFGHVSFNVQVNKEKNNIYSEENIENVEYVLDNFESLIDNNDNLSNKTKEFLKITKIIIEENKEFINASNLQSFFKYICVDYDVDLNAFSRASGIYVNALKYMLISESENGVNKSLLLHEVLHGYSMNFHNTAKLGYNFYLNEIVTQVYTMEYTELLDLEEFNSIYDNDIVIVYMLAHLVGVDVIKEYRFNNNSNIVADALIEKGANKSDVSFLLECINNIHKCSDVEIDDNYLNLYSTFKRIHESISDIPLEDDIKFILYLQCSQFNTLESELYFVKFLLNKNLPSYSSVLKIDLEYIISDQNIELKPNPIIEFSDGSVYIVEKNRQNIR